jgi:hypothetical protein
MQKINRSIKLFASSSLNRPIHSDIEQDILREVSTHLDFSSLCRLKSLSPDFNEVINQHIIKNHHLEITNLFLSKTFNVPFKKSINEEMRAKTRHITIKENFFISPFFEIIKDFYNLEILKIEVKTPNHINRHLSKLTSLKNLKKIDLSQCYIDDCDFASVPKSIKALIFGYSIQSSNKIDDLNDIPNTLTELSISCALNPDGWKIVKEKTTPKSSIYLCDLYEKFLVQSPIAGSNYYYPEPDEVPNDMRPRVKSFFINKANHVFIVMNEFTHLETLEITDINIFHTILTTLKCMRNYPNKPLNIVLPQKHKKSALAILNNIQILNPYIKLV